MGGPMTPPGRPLGGPMTPLGGPIIPGGRAMTSIPGPEGSAPPGAPPKTKGPAGWKSSEAVASLFLT